MAELNPGYQTKHEETYLNYSRGAQSPDALRTPGSQIADPSLVNLGNFAVEGAKVKNNLIEDRIYNEVVADVDNIRDAWTGASPETGATDANTPADLTRQIKRMEAVVNANKNNRMTDEAYWMQMENIARATRSRYPGHREYIDRVVSSITGGTPANVLQRMVTQAASNAQDSETKRRDWVEKELIKKGIRPQQPGNYTTDELENWLSRQNEIDLSSQRRRNNLTERSKDREVTTAEISEDFNREVDVRLAMGLKEQTDNFLKRKSELIANSSDRRLDEKAYQEVQAAGIQLREARRALVTEIANGYPGLSAGDRKAKIEAVMAETDAMTSDLANGRYNILDSMANRQKALETNDDAAVLASVHGRRHAAIRRVYGENVLNTILSNNEEELRDFARLVNENFILEQSDPSAPVPSFAEGANDILDNNKTTDDEKTAQLNQRLRTSVNVISSADAPIELRVRHAQSLFGPAEGDNLLRFIDDDVSVFQQLNSPQMAQEMLKLKEQGNEQLYQDYLKWRDLSFNYIYKTEMNSAQTIVVDRSSMRLSRTENGGLHVEYVPRQGIGAASLSPIDNAWEGTAAWFSGAEDAVNTLNGAIDGMRATWQLEGKDAKQEIDKLLLMGGVKLGAPNTPMGPSTLAAAIGDFLMDPIRGMASDVSAFLNAQERDRQRQNDLRNDDISQLSGDPFLSDLQGVMDFARSQGYQPGQRESTNVEDRTMENSGLLRAGENFQVPGSTQNSLDGLSGDSIEDSLRAIFGDRAPMMLSNWDTLSPTTQQEILSMYPGQQMERGSPGSRDHSLLPPKAPDNNYAINDPSYGARVATESVSTQQEADHWADYLQFRITNNKRYIKAIEESDTMTDPARKKEIIRLSKERQKVFEEAYKEFKKNLPKDLPSEVNEPDTPMN